jgi:hypothetical protein
MIEKPLFDLQMDMSSLHTGIATSLHAIKDKIEEQQAVNFEITVMISRSHSYLNLSFSFLV